MPDSVIVIWAAGGILFAIVGMLIGGSRGRPGAGFLCGLLLGPLGCVLALFLPKEIDAAETKAKPWRPGQPTRRERRLPIKGDPMEEWEMKQRARQDQGD